MASVITSIPAPPCYASLTATAVDRDNTTTALQVLSPPAYQRDPSKSPPRLRTASSHQKRRRPGFGTAAAMSTSTDSAIDASPTATSPGAGVAVSSTSGKHATLTMSLSDNVVFLYPNRRLNRISTSEEDILEEDASDMVVEDVPCIVVTLHLHIPVHAKVPVNGIQSLTVELYAKESLGFPNASFESNTLHMVTKSIEGVSDVKLEPGHTYTFETVLEVPDDTTPSQTCRVGYVHPRVRATLQWNNDNQKSRWLGGNALRPVQVEQDVLLIAVPRSSNNLGYARTHHSVVDGLGPLVIHARSHHLTSGGYLRMGMSLPDMVPGVEVKGITMCLLQTATLTSRKPKSKPVTTQTERMYFMEFDAEQLATTLTRHDDGSVSGEWIARLPDHCKARPTTLSGSKDAAIRYSHKMEFRLVYRKQSQRRVIGDLPDSEDNQATVYYATWPFMLSSCQCRFKSMVLPRYAERDPMSAETTQAVSSNKVARSALRLHHTPNDFSSCTCGMTMDELLDLESEQDVGQHASSVDLLRREIRSALSSSVGGQPESDAATDAAAAARRDKS